MKKDIQKLEDREFQDKKHYFVEEQIDLFKEAFKPRDQYKMEEYYITKKFSYSAYMLPVPKFSKGDTPPKITVQQPREWPVFSNLMPEQQYESQNYMRYACELIMERTDYFRLPRGIMIDFKRGLINWNDMMYFFSDAVVIMNGIEGIATIYDIPAGDRLNGIIYIGNVTDRTNRSVMRAFLKTERDDGKEYFCELEHFSMQYLLNVEAVDEEYEGTELAYINPDKDTGIFTLFSKAYNLLYTTVY